MVNNSANKANNQLSSQIIDCKKKTMAYDLRIQVLA